MSVAKIARMLLRRPPGGRFREQLFWLVDLIYACKSSGVEVLAREARLVEDALGALGEYLETGNDEALAAATARVEQFAYAIRAAVVDDEQARTAKDSKR